VIDQQRERGGKGEEAVFAAVDFHIGFLRRGWFLAGFGGDFQNSGAELLLS
jgi:hypothetical protein